MKQFWNQEDPNKAVGCLIGLGSHGAEELALLLQGLESAVTVLGRSIDELDIEGLQVRTLGNRHHTLAKSDGTLAGTSNATLDHEEILVDLAVVRETTHGGDALLGQIRLGGTRHGVTLLADAKHTLVDLGTVMVTLLTSAGNGGFNAGRMPSTNTGDLTKTSVGLSGKAGNTPTTHHTGETVTTGGSADVKHLALAEHLGDINLLLEQTTGEVDLGGGITTVDLDLHKVSNLLSELDLSDLGVGKDTHNLAVLLDALNLGLDLLGLLSSLLGVLGESLLLGGVPVLVETTLEVIGQVVGPHGGQGSQAVGGGDVANNTNNHHGGSLQDGDSLNCLLLVELGSRSLDLSHHVTHTSLEAHEGGQVGSLGSIVLGERPNATSVVSSSLLGQVLQGPVTGSFEFTVRHDRLGSNVIRSFARRASCNRLVLEWLY